jgi:uncharacterized sulfatase
MKYLIQAISLTLALLATCMHAADKPLRPNILFILTDDQACSTLSCYGNRLFATPHLDSLAREGMRFTDAYVTPQCTPTRATLFTGQDTARNGMWHVIPWYGSPWAPVWEPPFVENLSRETFTLPKGIRSAGYITGTAGKWHLTVNADGNYSGLKPQAGPAYGFDYVAPPGPGTHNAGDKWVNYLTDSAIGFIEAHRDRPWFFYLAHHTPHNPVSAPEELVAKYLARGMPAKGLNNATYCAAIEHLDNSVGRLLAKLDDLHLRERTIVIFMADNGGVQSIYDPDDFTGKASGRLTQLRVKQQEFDNAPLRAGKGTAYEAGIRVPCLVRWPGVVKPQSVCTVPIQVADWLPTLLEIAGTGNPPGHVLDGQTLTPVLRGEILPERPLFWYMPLYDLRWGATPCAVIRRGDWKLIEFFGDRFDAEGRYVAGHRLELYNLRDDIGERHDLAATARERAGRLHDELRAWLKGIPAAAPGPNPHHDPAKEFLETRIKPDFLD